MNPFVGGGTNWMVLTAQKAGFDPISPVYYYMRKSSIDLSTEQGVKDLQATLLKNMQSKNTNIRFAIGAVASVLTYAIVKGTDAEDSYEEWLKKNSWAKKYLDVFPPSMFVLLMAKKNDEMGRYFEKLFGQSATFDEGAKLVKGITEMASNDEQANERGRGKMGDLLGSRVSTPIIPWRMVRDITKLAQGASGKPSASYDFNAIGFWNGFYKGGLVEQLGLRPERTFKKNIEVFNDDKTISKFLSDKKLRIEINSDMDVIDSGKETPLSDKQINEYEEKWSKYVLSDLKEGIKELKGKSDKEVKETVADIKSVATIKSMQDLGVEPKTFNTFTREGQKYVLSDKQIKSRIRLKKEYMDQYGNELIDTSTELLLTEGIAKGKARRKAIKSVNEKANNKSKEDLIAEIGLEAISKAE